MKEKIKPSLTDGEFAKFAAISVLAAQFAVAQRSGYASEGEQLSDTEMLECWRDAKRFIDIGHAFLGVDLFTVRS